MNVNVYGVWTSPPLSLFIARGKTASEGKKKKKVLVPPVVCEKKKVLHECTFALYVWRLRGNKNLLYFPTLCHHFIPLINWKYHRNFLRPILPPLMALAVAAAQTRVGIGRVRGRRVAVKATVMLTLESFMSAVHIHIVVGDVASKRDFFSISISAQKNSALLHFTWQQHTIGRAITGLSTHAKRLRAKHVHGKRKILLAEIFTIGEKNDHK